MKKAYYIVIAAACVLSVIGCKKSDSEPEFNNNTENLVLSASVSDVTCYPMLDKQLALQLTWSAGTNHGTGSSLAYTVDIDLEENAFAGGVHFKVGRTMDRTLALSNIQLADSLSRIAPVGKSHTFICRVRGTILMTGEEQVSNTVRFTSTYYTPLYIIGDVVPNGWDRSKAPKMVEDTDNPHIFTWHGWLRISTDGKKEFRFLTSRDSWIPSFVRNHSDASQIVYRRIDTDYDETHWAISQNGTYDVKVDALNYRMYYDRCIVYMLGDATSTGWSWDNMAEVPALEEDVYQFEGSLAQGEIKFPLEKNAPFAGKMIFAPTADCAPVENGTFDIHTGDPDNKWKIPEAGTWRITINMKNKTISFKKL